MVWRLIYNDTEIFSLFETSDITLTKNYIFDGNTIEECYTKIEELKFDFEYTLDEITYTIFENGMRTTEIRTNNKQ
jgi:hypothetical protein